MCFFSNRSLSVIIIEKLRGNDYLYGEAGNDKLYGRDGSDFLKVTGGNNTLYGGKGNDALSAGSGKDKLYGEDGDDYLYSYSSSGGNQLYGGKGNDTLNTGYTSEGNTLEGGAGNDSLNLGYGRSIGHSIIYKNGDGNDVIEGIDWEHDILDIRGAKYSWKRVNAHEYDVLLTVGKGSILLKYAYGETLTINDRDGKNQKVTFKNDTGKNIVGTGKLNGTSGDDALNGYGNNIVLHGMAGDDYLTVYWWEGSGYLNSNTKGTFYGDAGDDFLGTGVGIPGDYTLYGGKGNDIFYAEKSNSTLYGGDGNDSLSGGLILDGGKGNDSLYTAIDDNDNAKLYGGDGNDYLETGNHNCMLNGGNGNDTLFYIRQWSTTIVDSDNDNTKLYGGDGNDYLETGNHNCMLNGGNGNDTLCSRYWKSDSDNINRNIKLYGGDGNDSLYGYSDILDGGKGNDTLSLTLGRDVNSTLRGGKGNDLLTVETNSYDNYDNKVRYIYANGDGNDTIANFNSLHDILDLRGADYTWKKSGTSDVRIAVGKGSILLQGVYGQAIKINDKNNKTKTVRLTTSKTLSKRIEGTSSGETLQGGNGNDVIYGFGGEDYLIGESGNDRLYGGDGADTLYGGKGNDTLESGSGNDRFIYKNGDGNDTITDFECCKWTWGSSADFHNRCK